MEESAKKTVLATQLQVHEQLAKARAEFTSRLLEKEIEVVELHAEVELAHQRLELGNEIAEAVVEYERVAASLELSQTINEQLQSDLAKAKSNQSEALAASKADNAKLNERIATLEERLESINVRLAEKPGDSQVK